MQTNWKLVSLADFSTKEKNSFVNGPFGSDLLSSELVDEGYPVIYIKDLTNGRYQKKSSYYVTEQKYNSLSACQVAYGDVLISKVGSPPCEAAIYDCKIPAIVTQDVIRIKTSSLHASQFLAQLLNSDFGRKKINTIKITGTRERVSLTDLKKVKFLLPPDDIQQKIAEILSTWDKAITSTENLIANSEMQKKALMQQLLTGKKRLLDENGVRFSGEWKKYILKNISNTFNGLTGKTKEDFGEGSLFITYMNIYTSPGISTFINCDRVKILPNEKQHTVKRGDVFFTTSSETPEEVGLSSVLLKDPNEPIYLNSFSFGIRFNDNIYIKPEFSQFLFRSPNSRKQISALAQGSTRFNLSKTNFMKLSFNIPIRNEQDKIAKVLSNADREIELLQAKLRYLKQEKKALMQQLLTGKRRVVIN